MNTATNYLFPGTIGIISICYLTTGYFHISIATTICIVATILAAIYILSFRTNQLLSTITTSPFEKTLSASSRTNIFRVFFSANSAPQNGGQSPKPQQKNRTRRKIDPKHIIQELISIWGTTYTVITWGSFYLIGGTIVASERLAQKVKSKCSREQRGLHNESSSRGTGWTEFTNFASSSSADVSRNSTTSDDDNQRNTFRRISSWSKRSYSTSKRKLTKLFTSTNAPQLTESP